MQITLERQSKAIALSFNTDNSIAYDELYLAVQDKMSAIVNGGKFFVGKAFTIIGNAVSVLSKNIYVQGLTVAAAGGLGSRLAGGSFELGFLTAGLAFAVNQVVTQLAQEGDSDAWRDNVKDIDKLDGLSDEFRPRAEAVLKELSEQGHKLRVVWGKRTPEENQLLVDQGNASRNSLHLTGDALDFVNREIGYDNINYPEYNAAVEQAAKNAGVIWGGDFKSRWDPNHIELKR